MLTDAEREFLRIAVAEARAASQEPSPLLDDAEPVAETPVPSVGDPTNGQPKPETAADHPKPYGEVSYADPENGKYPIDTEEHVRAAWSYINQKKNAATYSPEKLAQVKAAIRRAAKKFGIEISESADACWHDAGLAVADDKGTVSDARRVRADLVRMLITEAQEDLDGDNETWDILSLAQAISYLDGFIANEEFEVVMEAMESARATAAQADPSKTFRFRCSDCGKFMRLRPGNRRITSATQGGDMPANDTVTITVDALMGLASGLEAALAAVQQITAAAGAPPPPGAKKVKRKGVAEPMAGEDGGDGGDMDGDGGAAADDMGDMSPTDSDSVETPPAIPTKASNLPEDESPSANKGTGTPGSLPADGRAAPAAPTNDNAHPMGREDGGDASPDGDMSPRDSDSAETPPAIPTKANQGGLDTDPSHPHTTEAGMTLVMHDNGDNSPPTVHTDGQPAHTPPPPAHHAPPPPPGQHAAPQDQEGQPAPQDQDQGGDKDDTDDDDQAAAFKNPEEHRADQKTFRDTTPRARAALEAGDPDAAQAALEDAAREAATRAFGENGNVRRTFRLESEADLNAWFADLEAKQQTASAFASLANLGQVGTPDQEADRAARIRKQKVATAAQDVPGEVPEIDLRLLFMR